MKKIVKVVIIFITILGILNLAQIRTYATEVENTNINGTETQQAETKQTETIQTESNEAENEKNETDKTESKTQETKKDKVSLSKTKKTIYVGEKYTLKIKGTSKKAKWWKSSNTKVATVNSKGKVTAKKKGTAEITAKIAGKKYKCTIKVKNLPTDNKSTVKVGNSQIKKVTRQKKALKLNLKKVNGVSGYQIRYSTAKNLKKYKDKKTAKTKITIKKLKRKTTYYIKVRAYKKLGSVYSFGNFSKVKKVKTK